MLNVFYKRLKPSRHWDDVRVNEGLDIVVGAKAGTLEDEEGVGYIVTHGAVDDAVMEDVVIAMLQEGGFCGLVGGGKLAEAFLIPVIKG